jgi:tRNA threonylcarbamoyladenosine biosynthesis protein TsaB
VNVLAIETATACLSCALWSGDGPLACYSLVAGRRHAEVLMPAVDQLLRQCGLSPTQLDAIAVDHGPGLFTGLRVGLATAGAMSAALGIPCAGVSSLDALAHRHRRRPGLLAAVVDARRAEVYWSLYEADGASVAAVTAPQVAGPGQVADELAALGRPVLAVGDGAWRYRALVAEAGAELAGPTELWPRAEIIAELAVGELAEGRAGVGTPAAVYLRQADVRIGWDQLGGRVGPDAPAATVP